MKHTIDIEDLKHFEPGGRIAGQHNIGINKSLDFYIIFVGGKGSIIYKVSTDKKCIYRSSELNKAVDMYNSIN